MVTEHAAFDGNLPGGIQANVAKRVILSSLLICICLGVGESIRIRTGLAVIPVFAPLVLINIPDFILFTFEAAYVTIMCALATIGWRKRSFSLAILFSCLLLGFTMFGLIKLDGLVRDLDRDFRNIQIVPMGQGL
jgi:hypothetical protein